MYSRRRSVRLASVLVLVASTAIAISTAHEAASASPVPIYLNVPSDGLTVAGAGSSATLYTFASCGSEFTPAVPTIYARATGVQEQTLPVPTSALQAIYDPPDCNGEQPVGERVAAWNDRLYWIAADGEILGRSLTGAGFLSWPLVAQPPLLGGGPTPGLAVDDASLSWTESDAAPGSGMTVYDIPASPAGGLYPGGRVRGYHVSGTLSRLTAGPGGTRFVIDTEPGAGSVLRALVPAGNGHYTVQTISVGRGVTAVTADNGAVYWAESNSGAYVIYQASVMVDPTGTVSLGIARPVTSRTGFASTMRVTNLVVDPASTQPARHDLWWNIFETGRPDDPSILHLVRSTGRVDALFSQTEVSTVQAMATDGRYLFWTDTGAVFRALATNSAPHLLGDPLTTADVSPDLPYLDGTTADQTSNDPGGRIIDMVVDPAHDNTLIAASEFAGIWRSTDGGQNWSQSNTGVKWGLAQPGQKLAIDTRGRLLYATYDEESQADSTTTARVYASHDDGRSWLEAALPRSCGPQLVINSVTFAGTTGWVSANCGLYTSNDLYTWTRVTSPGTPPGGAFISGSGPSLFACWDNTVYLTTDGGGTWAPHVLPSGTCRGTRQLAAAPSADSTPTRSVIAIHGTDDQTVDADFVTFGATRSGDTDRQLGFPAVPTNPSGIVGVWAAPTNSGGVTVIGANGDNYYEWSPPTTWHELPNIHIDAQAFATPRTYDPAHGNCVAYVADDGSVAKNTTLLSSTSTCTTYSGPWLRAQHGLHAFKTQMVNGVHRQTCHDGGGFVYAPCPVLYAVSGDNGAWERDQTGSSTWTSFTDCCGDVGGASIDPAMPNRLELTRGTMTLQEYISRGTYVPSTQAGSLHVPPNYLDLDFPSSPSGASQVRTVPGEAAVADDVAMRVIPDGPDPAGGGDQVVRRLNGGEWVSLGPTLPGDLMPQLATSGGHNHLVVWVRTGGFVYRGIVNSTGQIPAWTRLSSPNMDVAMIWANPWNPDELWIEDDYNHVIDRGASTPSGGYVWTRVQDLTGYALGYDPRFGTNTLKLQRSEPDGSTRLASLNHLFFPALPNSPIRVASLGTGGVAVSHDAGNSWIPLSTLPWDQWLAHPWSTWLDPGSEDGGSQSDLYIGLDGRGVIRVTAPFDTLVDVNYQYCGAVPCDSSGSAIRSAAISPAADTSSVSVVDDLTGRTFPMTHDADGTWRASELLNGVGIGSLQYHFVVDGVPGAPQSHSLTDAERTSGQVGVAAVGTGPSPFLPSVGPASTSALTAYTEVCPGTDPVVHVSVPITVAAGTGVTGAVLAVRTQTVDEFGDPQTRLVAQVPMSAEKDPIWSASLDTTALGIDLGDSAEQAALLMQVTATAKGGQAAGPPFALRLQPCLSTKGSVPGAPIAVGVKPAHRSLDVSWQPPADDGGQPITGYQVIVYVNGRPLPTEYLGRSETSGAIVGLSPKASYTVTVQALNVFGPGAVGGPAGPVTPLP